MQRRRKCSSSGLRSSSAMMSSLHQKSWQQPFHHDQARKNSSLLLLFFFQVFFYAQQQTLLLSFCNPTFTSLYFTSFYVFQILRLSKVIPSLVLDHVVQNAQYFIFCVSPFLSFLLRDLFLLEICVPKIVFLVVIFFRNPEMHQPILQSYGSY